MLTRPTQATEVETNERILITIGSYLQSNMAATHDKPQLEGQPDAKRQKSYAIFHIALFFLFLDLCSIVLTRGLTLSSTLGNLGTETAYAGRCLARSGCCATERPCSLAVAAEAKALGATGKKIYPLHIGDLNFPTPACIKEAAHKAVNEGNIASFPCTYAASSFVGVR